MAQTGLNGALFLQPSLPGVNRIILLLERRLARQEIQLQLSNMVDMYNPDSVARVIESCIQQRKQPPTMVVESNGRSTM